MYRNRSSHRNTHFATRGGSLNNYSGVVSRSDDGLRVHRTIYNDAARRSGVTSERDRSVRMPSYSLSSRRSTSDRRPALPSTNRRLRLEPATAKHNHHAQSRSRSPVQRSADDLRNAIGRKDRTSEQYECTTCGAIPCPLDRHLTSVVHERRLNLCKLGCRLCGITGFSNYPQYRDHIRTEQHKINKDRIHGNSRSPRQDSDSEENGSSTKRRRERESYSEFLTVDAAGCFQEENVVYEDRKAKSSKSSRDNYANNNIGRTNGRISSESDTKPTAEQQEQQTGLREVPQVQDPTISYGVECIQPIKGMYCRLCKKFFTSEKAALELHAKSAAHFTAYKRYTEMENLRYSAAAGTTAADNCEPTNATSASVSDTVTNADCPAVIVGNGTKELQQECLEQAPQVDPAAYENEESL